MAFNYVTKTATIASGEALSSRVNMEGRRLAAIIMPAAWSTADLTFQASQTVGGTLADVYDDDGREVMIAAAAGWRINLDANALLFQSLVQEIAIRSGTSATPVNQAAARELTLVLVKD